MSNYRDPRSIVVRHGERPPAMGECGSTPDDLLELTPEGVNQSRALGARLGERVFGIISSPVLRCRQTAKNIAIGCGLESAEPTCSSMLAPDAFSLENLSEAERQGVAHQLLTGTAQPCLQEKADLAVLEMFLFFKHHTTQKTANVFVSHDWVMALFLARISDCFARHSWNVWPAFLEYFTIDFHSFTVVYRDQLYPIQNAALDQRRSQKT